MLKRLALGILLVLGLALNCAAEESSIASNFTVSTWIDTPGGGVVTTYSPEAPTDEGKLRFNCEWSHLLYDDPITGANGTTHLHMFFGNTGANVNSTYSSLRQTGNGSCSGGPINRTPYWFPALIDATNNKVRKPDSITVYYQVNRQDLVARVSPAGWTQEPSQRFPRGLKFIGGYRMDLMDGTTTFTVKEFGCTDGSGGVKEFLWHRSNNSLGVQNCPSDKQLYVRMELPDCWDNSTFPVDASNGFHTLRKRAEDGHGNFICPTTHRYPLPIITIEIFWSHNGSNEHSTWYFSSDRFNAADKEAGETIHTDWIGAWDDDVMATWTAEVNGIPLGGSHVRATTNGNLGDGTSLDESMIILNAETGADRLIDIPAIPAAVEYLAAARWRMR